MTARLRQASAGPAATSGCRHRPACRPQESVSPYCPAPMRHPSPGQASSVVRSGVPARAAGPIRLLQPPPRPPRAKSAVHQGGFSWTQPGLLGCHEDTLLLHTPSLCKGHLARRGHLFQPRAVFKARTSPLDIRFQLLLNPGKTVSWAHLCVAAGCTHRLGTEDTSDQGTARPRLPEGHQGPQLLGTLSLLGSVCQPACSLGTWSLKPAEVGFSND